MGGVGTHDQILTNYNLAQKAMKWYKKYFFHLFDICVFDAACLYAKDPVNKSVTNLKYREILRLRKFWILLGRTQQPSNTDSLLSISAWEKHQVGWQKDTSHHSYHWLNTPSRRGTGENTSRTVFFALGRCMLTNRTVVLALSTSAQNVVMSPSARHHVSRNTTLCLNSNSCTCQIRRQGCQETLSKTLPGLDYIYNNYILLHSLHNFTLYLMASSQLCE